MIEGVSSQSEPPTSPVLLPLWRPPGICREASKVKIWRFLWNCVIDFFWCHLLLSRCFGAFQAWAGGPPPPPITFKPVTGHRGRGSEKTLGRKREWEDTWGKRAVKGHSGKGQWKDTRGKGQWKDSPVPSRHFQNWFNFYKVTIIGENHIYMRASYQNQQNTNFHP